MNLNKLPVRGGRPRLPRKMGAPFDKLRTSEDARTPRDKKMRGQESLPDRNKVAVTKGFVTALESARTSFPRKRESMLAFASKGRSRVPSGAKRSEKPDT